MFFDRLQSARQAKLVRTYTYSKFFYSKRNILSLLAKLFTLHHNHL
jgi:hypothetical protein